MGKQTNAQVLRFCKNKDWFSKYYSSNYKYSHFTLQDNLIHDYVINFIAYFNTKVAQVYVYRKKHYVIIRIFSYNDSFTNWKSYLLKHRKKINYRNKVGQPVMQDNNIIFGLKKSINAYNWFKVTPNLQEEVLFFKNREKLDYIYCDQFSNNLDSLGYSGKRLLSLNLSYLLKTPVLVKNTNIINKNQRSLLLKLFSYMGYRLRSPLSKHLRVKFICLVYYSFLYKSSLLLCRYLSFIIPRFCKKKRKSRKINPFLKSLKSVISILFGNNFSKHAQVKGIKVVVKGRINGSRRKRIYVIKQGYTSTQSFNNEVSYYQEDCLTIFGTLGIKVWIIY